jgi:hypothetical protein
MSTPFRGLPAVARVLEAPAAVAARDRHPAAALTAAARDVLEAVRARLSDGDDAGDTSAEAIASQVVSGFGAPRTVACA